MASRNGSSHGFIRTLVRRPRNVQPNRFRPRLLDSRTRRSKTPATSPNWTAILVCRAALHRFVPLARIDHILLFLALLIQHFQGAAVGLDELDFHFMKLPVFRPSRRRVRNAVLMPQKRSHGDRKSTRLNSSLSSISYAVFCLKKKKKKKKKHRIHKKKNKIRKKKT